MVLKLSVKVHFLQFCADLSKKSKSIKAIYIYASERSRYTLSENGIVYYAMTLTDLDFLLRSAQYCKKCTFIDNLRTITQEGNIETRQMSPFFPSTFSALTVCNIHFCI